MYTVRVEDFIDVKESKSSFDLNDMIHICKRHNNPKREYLFVNKYQAKHYPINPKMTLRLFDELYGEIEKEFAGSDRKILVIGFAETATAIAQRVTHNALTKRTVDVVYHLQTTREKIRTKIPNINFDEQHSHAVSQKLYYDAEHIPDYDTVLFVEDEITTGTTIINFIEQFKEINPTAKYAVASILNWQNEENEKKYEDMGITTIYLVKGYIKKNLPCLKIKENSVPAYNSISIEEKVLEDQENPRTGLTPSEFMKYISKVDNLKERLKGYRNTKVAIVGTEENMYIPILLAEYLGVNAVVRSTTRSPISVSNDTKYLINNGIKIPSAYEAQRATYLYNIDPAYRKMLIIVEAKTFDFEKYLETALRIAGVREIAFVYQ